jgi:hypothetical protein
MRRTPLGCTLCETHPYKIRACEIHKNKKYDRERCMPARNVRLEEMYICLEEMYAYKRYVLARNACLYMCPREMRVSFLGILFS